jgi:hypothetical protein
VHKLVKLALYSTIFRLGVNQCSAKAQAVAKSEKHHRKIGLVFSNAPPSMSRLNFSGRVEAHHPADQEPAFSCIAGSGSGKTPASRQRS